MSDICVVICTCDRPQLLEKLLQGLDLQARESGARVFIVDNGAQSAAHIAAASPCPNTYVREDEPGLVAVRNRALRLAVDAAPRFIAFIDDDEVPERDWLKALRSCLESTGADIACGPYLPDYAATPPRWVVDGDFFSKSGDCIATGNLIVRAACLPKDPAQWFKHEFSFSGGEDEEFFSRLIAGGAKFAVASEARIREHVPASRMRLSYMLRNGFRDGLVDAQLLRVRYSGLNKVARIVAALAAKIGYCLNHLFWSPGASWRLVAAARDLAAAAGIVLNALGLKVSFYGRPAKPVASP